MTGGRIVLICPLFPKDAPLLKLMSSTLRYPFTVILTVSAFLIHIRAFPQGKPVSIEACLRNDFIGLSNFDKKQYLLFHGEADISFSALTEDLKLYRGGELFIQAMGILGNKASQNYALDLQIFSNIESDNRIFLYQAYYRHTIGKVTVKAGQLDMNSEYSVSGYGSSLLNSSFGVIPTISLNMPVSIFSYLSAGISVKYALSGRISLQTALFNGNPGNFETNRHNLIWRFSRDEGYFNISEIHFRTRNNLMTGKYKAGIFYHSGTFADYNGNRSPCGKAGFYLMGDQQITREKNTIKNGLSMFFEVSVSPSETNLINSYYGLGLIYRGIFRNMNEDECTIALASAHLSEYALSGNPDFRRNETALEVTYKKYITPGIIIQPDFQYIINPGASRSLYGNVAAGIIRAIIIL